MFDPDRVLLQETSGPSRAFNELDRLFARAEWLGATASELGHLDGVRSASRIGDVTVTALMFPGAVVGALAGAPAFSRPGIRGLWPVGR